MAKKIEYPGTTNEPADQHLYCPWNDRGTVCGKRGSMSDNMNGNGPWYCSDHYWQLKGHHKSIVPDGPKLSYRERWYAERNLPYQPPRGGLNVKAMPPRREPGEDDDSPEAA